MVRPTETTDDFAFIMACVKHTSGKPDFDEVAKELGAKSKDACYKRHWTILRKWGLSGKGKASGTNGTPNSGQKRRRVTPAEKPAKDNEEEDELGEGEDEDAPSERKKAKMAAPAGVTPKVESDEDADELR